MQQWGMTVADDPFAPLRGKLLFWFVHFTDHKNRTTFLNNTQSAIAAGYKCKNFNGFAAIGAQNYQKLRPRIEHWLDEEGLSEARIKERVVALMSATQTYHAKIKGKVDKENLSGCRVVAETEQSGTDKDGLTTTGTETLLAVEHEALSIQAKGVELACKIKRLGAFGKTTLDIENLDDLPERLAAAIARSGGGGSVDSGGK
jgi:hypothetical protein